MNKKEVGIIALIIIFFVVFIIGIISWSKNHVKWKRYEEFTVIASSKFEHECSYVFIKKKQYLIYAEYFYGSFVGLRVKDFSNTSNIDWILNCIEYAEQLQKCKDTDEANALLRDAVLNYELLGWDCTYKEKEND